MRDDPKRNTPGEPNLAALTVDPRHPKRGSAGASEYLMGCPDHLRRAERSRVAEDPDRLAGTFRGLRAVPQPVRHEHEGLAVAVFDGPGIAADLLACQWNTHSPEIQY